MEIMTGWWITLLAPLGVVVVGVALGVLALSRFKKANIAMDATEFFTRLIWGRGFSELGPETLHRRLKTQDAETLLVDLREPRNFVEGHIEGVTHRPFDDFLREVVAEGQFEEYREKDVVLICDTGHMSRVAGEILGQDLGFTRVFSLKGGMKRWWKWEATQASRSYPLCGPTALFGKCCPQGA